MSSQDIRWAQRLDNYKGAFDRLREAVTSAHDRKLSDLEKQGLIHILEYTHELAWKTMKDFIESKGGSNVYGSKDATREAFQLELIGEGEVWMEMIKSRNESSHTYNEEVAEKISRAILDKYYPQLAAFKSTMEAIRTQQ